MGLRLTALLLSSLALVVVVRRGVTPWTDGITGDDVFGVATVVFVCTIGVCTLVATSNTSGFVACCPNTPGIARTPIMLAGSKKQIAKTIVSLPLMIILLGSNEVLNKFCGGHDKRNG
jgi:hypothetical protein